MSSSSVSGGAGQALNRQADVAENLIDRIGHLRGRIENESSRVEQVANHLVGLAPPQTSDPAKLTPIIADVQSALSDLERSIDLLTSRVNRLF